MKKTKVKTKSALKMLLKLTALVLSVVLMLSALPLGAVASEIDPVVTPQQNNVAEVTEQTYVDGEMLAGVENIDTSLSETEELPPLSETQLSAVIKKGKMERISVDNVPDVVGFESAKSKNHVARAYDQEKEELNALVFLNQDGTYTKYVYDYPVKFIDENGTIKDTSLDIIADTDGGYKRKQGGTFAKFPEKMADGINLSGGGVSVSLVPKQQITVKPLPELSKITTKVLKGFTYSTEKINSIDKKTVSYYYDDSTSLEYGLTYTGFKEDIVVSEYTGQTDYVFTLKTGGLELIEIDGYFYLADVDGNVKATLGEVIIFTADEKNNAFGSMSAVTVKENEEYTVTVHVDADYLKDEKTQYPIRIDPTIELTESGNSLVEDVVINSDETVSRQTTPSLKVGKNADGTYSRILIKFNYDFGSFTDGPLKIHRAYVEMRDVMCQTESMTVMSEMFVGTSWTENATQWETFERGVHTHYMASMPINYAKGDALAVAHRYSISILDAVKYWVAEANNTPNYYQESPYGGIMIKAYDEVEQGNTEKLKYFASSQHSNTSFRPSLAITYYDTHTQYSDPFGHLDAVTSNSIRGWVWCVDLPQQSVPVTIYLKNKTTGKDYPPITLEGEDTALYRPDVHDGGYGTGRYGFNYPIDWSEYSAGQYEVRAKWHSMNGTSLVYDLFNSPKVYVNKGILLDKIEFSMDVGDRITLSLETLIGISEVGDLIWTSSNPHVATVLSDGTVTAYRAGATTITATDGTYSASCTINSSQILTYPDTLINDNATRERIVLLKSLIDENEIAYYKNQLTGLEMSNINSQLQQQADIIRADYITIGSNPTSEYARMMMGGDDDFVPLEQPLTLNSEGFSVIVVQRALEVLGYYEPKESDTYGVFGDNAFDAACMYAEEKQLYSQEDGLFNRRFYTSLFSSENVDLITYEAYNQLNKYKTAHNYVAMWTANKVQGTYTMAENRITNGNSNGTYYGYADILKDVGDRTYIWEVKPDKEEYYKTNGKGEKQLNRYFVASQKYEQNFTKPLTIGYSVGQFSIPYINDLYLDVRSFSGGGLTDVKNALVLYKVSSIPHYVLEREYERVEEPEKSYNFSKTYSLNSVNYGVLAIVGIVVVAGVVCVALAPSTGGASMIGLAAL